MRAQKPFSELAKIKILKNIRPVKQIKYPGYNSQILALQIITTISGKKSLNTPHSPALVRTRNAVLFSVSFFRPISFSG